MRLQVMWKLSGTAGSAGEAGSQQISIRSIMKNNVKTQINTMFGTLGIPAVQCSLCSPVWTMESKIWKTGLRMQDPVWRR